MNNNYLNIFQTTTEHNKIYPIYNIEEPWVSVCEDTGKVYYNRLDEYSWIEIGGIRWCTKLLGAATSYDYTAKLYQWGDIIGYSEPNSSKTVHNYNRASYKFNDGYSDYNPEAWAKYSGDVLTASFTLNYDFDAAYIEMNKSTELSNEYIWRIPTLKELSVLVSHKVTLSSTTITGYDGTEIQLASTPGVGTVNGVTGMCFAENITGTTDVLFIPFRGNGYNNYVANVGNACFVWSSTLVKASPDYSYYMYAGKNDLGTFGQGKCFGYQILPIYAKKE